MAQTIRPHAHVVNQQLKCSFQSQSAIQALTKARKLLFQTRFTLHATQLDLSVPDRTTISFFNMAGQTGVARSLSQEIDKTKITTVSSQSSVEGTNLGSCATVCQVTAPTGNSHKRQVTCTYDIIGNLHRPGGEAGHYPLHNHTVPCMHEPWA